MRRKLGEDARRAVISAANEEVRRLGDRRVGTHHLLLGLLREPDSLGRRVLGVDLDTARATLTELDRGALRSIGIDATALDRETHRPPRRKPPFTSGFRSLLVEALIDTRAKRERVVGDQHLLKALLNVKTPDPASALLVALGVDKAEALRRLDMT